MMRDRPTTVTNALHHITMTTYDKVSNVPMIKDPALNTTTYTYDGLNRLLTDQSQLNQTRTYGYDANGNPTNVTDRNRQTRSFGSQRTQPTQALLANQSGTANTERAAV